MKLSKAIEQFIRDVALTKSRATAVAYESDLGRLRAVLPVDTVLQFTEDNVREFLHRESARGVAMSTLHRKMAALSEFGKWGVKQRLWNVNPVAAMDRIKKPKNLPRPFTQDETVRLWALDLAPDEAAIRAVLFYTGLRVTPITDVLIGHVSFAPPCIRVIVKGNKPQVIHLHEQLTAVLQGYIAAHTDGRAHSFLFSLRGRKLHRRHIERMTARWGDLAKVPDCTPHRFRHTFATELLRQGVDIRVIKEAMGHEDISSTMIYTEVDARAVAGGIARLSWGRA